jgi:hypothetical protein
MWSHRGTPKRLTIAGVPAFVRKCGGTPFFIVKPTVKAIAI